MKRIIAFLLAVAILALILTGCSDLGNRAPTGTGETATVSYAQVQNVFNSRCVQCHAGSNPYGGLNLTSYGSWQTATGPHTDSLIIPNQPEMSYLVFTLTTSNSQIRMPYGQSPLSPNQIDLITQWIAEGALETTISGGGGTGGGGGGGGGSGVFSSQVLPILESHCTGCHGSPASPDFANLDLTTYAGVTDPIGPPNAPEVIPFNADSSYLVKKIEATVGSIMPPDPMSPLTLDEIATIRNWIDAGALNDSGGGGGGGGGPVSYAQDIQPLFDQRCINCHSGAYPESEVDLTSYAHVMYGGADLVNVNEPAESELYKYVNGSEQPQMPLNGPFLTQGQISMILQWIQEGALNN